MTEPVIHPAIDCDQVPLDLRDIYCSEEGTPSHIEAARRAEEKKALGRCLSCHDFESDDQSLETPVFDLYDALQSAYTTEPQPPACGSCHTTAPLSSDVPYANGYGWPVDLYNTRVLDRNSDAFISEEREIHVDPPTPRDPNDVVTASVSETTSASNNAIASGGQVSQTLGTVLQVNPRGAHPFIYDFEATAYAEAILQQSLMTPDELGYYEDYSGVGIYEASAGLRSVDPDALFTLQAEAGVIPVLTPAQLVRLYGAQAAIGLGLVEIEGLIGSSVADPQTPVGGVGISVENSDSRHHGYASLSYLSPTSNNGACLSCHMNEGANYFVEHDDVNGHPYRPDYNDGYSITHDENPHGDDFAHGGGAACASCHPGAAPNGTLTANGAFSVLMPNEGLPFLLSTSGRVIMQPGDNSPEGNFPQGSSPVDLVHGAASLQGGDLFAVYAEADLIPEETHGSYLSEPMDTVGTVVVGAELELTPGLSVWSEATAGTHERDVAIGGRVAPGFKNSDGGVGFAAFVERQELGLTAPGLDLTSVGGAIDVSDGENFLIRAGLTYTDEKGNTYFREDIDEERLRMLVAGNFVISSPENANHPAAVTGNVFFRTNFQDEFAGFFGIEVLLGRAAQYARIPVPDYIEYGVEEAREILTALFSDAVYESYDIPEWLQDFDHFAHIDPDKEEPLSCVDCHDPNYPSSNVESNIAWIDTTGCGECHHIGEGKEGHVELPQASGYAIPQSETLRPVHATHLAADIECLECHSQLIEQEVALAHVEHRDSYYDCNACHSDADANGGQTVTRELIYRNNDANSCETCHTPLISREVPGAAARHPVNHGTSITWSNENHGFNSACFFCHDPVTQNESCQTCHVGPEGGGSLMTAHGFGTGRFDGDSMDTTGHGLGARGTSCNMCHTDSPNKCLTHRSDRALDCAECHDE